jgi:hypothetical protein
VANAIRRKFGLRSVVLWGPGEQPLAAAVVDASVGVAEIAPPTTIADMVGIARNAKLMISGDTGPLHIAGAVGTPIVALFGPTQPERNGPWSPLDVTVSRVSQCACLYERRCRKPARCIDDISVDEVIDAVITASRCMADRTSPRREALARNGARLAEALARRRVPAWIRRRAFGLIFARRCGPPGKPGLSSPRWRSRPHLGGRASRKGT